MSKPLKVGNRVKYVTNHYIDSISNPLWGGEHGRILGTIDSTGTSYHIQWDNGEENGGYQPEDLELYKGVSLMNIADKAKNVATTVHTHIKPYEKYIGLVALAVVIDHFLLGNKFTSRFKIIAEGVVTKITDGLDKLIAKMEV